MKKGQGRSQETGESKPNPGSQAPPCGESEQTEEQEVYGYWYLFERPPVPKSEWLGLVPLRRPEKTRTS